MAQNNLPSVTVDTFCKIVELQFKENNFRPIFGLGKGGIGKTESICDLAKKLNVGYIDIRLLLYSETDLKGIPYPNVEHTHTIWLQNNILPLAERDGERGILVFDEITSCARSVRTAAYQLLNERRLGEYVLPEGWLVVCLGNGEEDGGDYQGMEGNFANRCSVFNVEPNVEAWKLWAMAKNVNELVTAYVSFKPSDLHSYDPDSSTELLFASPRSWTAVSTLLNIYGYNENDNVLANRIMANLGTTVGRNFLSFCKFKDKTINPMEIIQYGVKFKPDSQEVIYITLHSVSKILSDRILEEVNAGKSVNNLSPEIYQWAANTFRWMMSLRKEYAVMGIDDFKSRAQDVLASFIVSAPFNRACPEFISFVTQNSRVYF